MLDAFLSAGGTWEGSYQVWQRPSEPPIQSSTSAVVCPAAGGRFVTITYTWSVDGEAQDGLLLIGARAGRGELAVRMIWIDSWHMGDQMMVSDGAVGADGSLSATGSYAAPEGPDWGWRTEIWRPEDGSLTILMFNIPPGDEPVLAVEASYRRRP